MAVIKGADWFTTAAIWLSQLTRIPKVLIGATVVSLATTLPEFAVSSYASYSGHPEMALGNAVGSASVNIGIILGLALLCRPCAVERRLLLGEGVFMIGAGAMVFALAWKGALTRANGLLLLAVLVLYIVVTVQSSLKSRRTAIANESAQEAAAAADQRAGWPINGIRFAGGAALVVLGSRLLVDAGATIAVMLRIPELVIALTLIALGTSLPELATSIAALLKGHQDLSLGNIIGANILNLTWVLGGAAVFNVVPVPVRSLRLDLPAMMVLFVAMVGFGLSRERFERWEGAALTGIYVTYLATLVGMAR